MSSTEFASELSMVAGQAEPETSEVTERDNTLKQFVLDALSLGVTERQISIKDGVDMANSWFPGQQIHPGHLSGRTVYATRQF